MPLLEGYFAKLSSYPGDEQKICVSLSYPHFVKRGSMRHLPILAPSRELLLNWRSDRITWQTYEERFREEITSNPQAMTALKGDSQRGPQERRPNNVLRETPEELPSLHPVGYDRHARASSRDVLRFEVL